MLLWARIGWGRFPKEGFEEVERSAALYWGRLCWLYWCLNVWWCAWALDVVGKGDGYSNSCSAGLATPAGSSAAYKVASGAPRRIFWRRWKSLLAVALLGEDEWGILWELRSKKLVMWREDFTRHESDLGESLSWKGRNSGVDVTYIEKWNQ